MLAETKLGPDLGIALIYVTFVSTIWVSV